MSILNVVDYIHNLEDGIYIAEFAKRGCLILKHRDKISTLDDEKIKPSDLFNEAGRCRIDVNFDKNTIPKWRYIEFTSIKNISTGKEYWITKEDE